MFYARHGVGVGEYFLDSLLLYARIYQKELKYHRLLSKRFPYAVYYDCTSLLDRPSGHAVEVVLWARLRAVHQHREACLPCQSETAVLEGSRPQLRGQADRDHQRLICKSTSGIVPLIPSRGLTSSLDQNEPHGERSPTALKTTWETCPRPRARVSAVHTTQGRAVMHGRLSMADGSLAPWEGSAGACRSHQSRASAIPRARH